MGKVTLTVSSDENVLGGVVCFDGTRIPLTAVMDFIHAGHSVSQINREYPTLTHDQIWGAWAVYEAASVFFEGEK